MKTLEQIEEYLRQIRIHRESWGPEMRKLNPSTEALIAVRVTEEVESALKWVLDQNAEHPAFMSKAERALADLKG
jgi:hypothetical protein